RHAVEAHGAPGNVSNAAAPAVAAFAAGIARDRAIYHGEHTAVGNAHTVRPSASFGVITANRTVLECHPSLVNDSAAAATVSLVITNRTIHDRMRARAHVNDAAPGSPTAVL